jgi:hypothetical protein
VISAEVVIVVWFGFSLVDHVDDEISRLGGQLRHDFRLSLRLLMLLAGAGVGLIHAAYFRFKDAQPKPPGI